MKRLLITGATGMLGATLYHFFESDYEVYTTGTQPATSDNLQKRYKAFNLNSSSFTELTDWAQPDIVIHSGAITKGDYCQKNPEEALRVNGLSTQKFIEAAPNAKLLYISSDAVFPSKIHLAKESDYVHPENVYGKSKELGEFFIQESIGGNHHIIRTTIVGLNHYPNRQGFAEWIINTLRKKETINLFSDVLFTPISIWHLADELAYLMTHDNLPVTFHISGSEVISKYDFGLALAKVIGLDTSLINQAKLQDVALAAKRSNDQTLDWSYYESVTKRKLPTLDQTIEAFVKHYQHKV